MAGSQIWPFRAGLENNEYDSSILDWASYTWWVWHELVRGDPFALAISLRMGASSDGFLHGETDVCGDIEANLVSTSV